MKKEIITEQTLKSWIDLSDRLNAIAIKLVKKLIPYAIKFIGIIIGYSIMSWIFLNIYDSVGFGKTLIIVLVGVLWYGVRQPPSQRIKGDANG